MTIPRPRRRGEAQRYQRWKAEEFAYSTWKLGTDQLADEQAVIAQFVTQRPWEECPDDDPMPYRPPRHTCLTEWEEDACACPIKPNEPDPDPEDEENEMVRMTRERMMILSALEEAGGAIEDANGSATARLAEAIGKDTNNLRPFNGTLQRMEHEGLIVRTKPTPTSKRTTRIALPGAGGYEFKDLIQALKDLGGAVEQNGEDAATLLRDVMQYDGSKKAFRDLLSVADREGAIVVERTGNRIRAIRLPDTLDTPEVELPVLTPEVMAAPEPGQYGYEEPDAEEQTMWDAVQSDSDLQKLGLFLLDEVVRRASTPEESAGQRGQREAALAEVAQLREDLDAAAKKLVDRMNQLDASNRRVKELEVQVTQLETLVKNAHLDIEKLNKELGRRPVGPKVQEIVSDDSRRQLENFKRLMQEKPTKK